MKKGQIIKLCVALGLIILALVIFFATRSRPQQPLPQIEQKTESAQPPPTPAPAAPAPDQTPAPAVKPKPEKAPAAPAAETKPKAAPKEKDKPQIKEVTEKYPSGEIRRRFKVYTDTPWIKHGTYVEYYKSGNKLCEIEFKENVHDGLLVCWVDAKAPAGKLLEGGFESGQKNGPFTEWHQNGKKKLSYTYKNGVLDGAWVEYYEDETKMTEMAYVNGTPSEVVKRYKPDGSVKQEDKAQEPSSSKGSSLGSGKAD